jgi:hypothetical protein
VSGELFFGFYKISMKSLGKRMKCWLKQERLYRRWREMLEIKMKKTLIP